MSKPKFVYCFSKTLASSEERYRISLELFKNSVKLLTELYTAKVYTDNSTVEDLSDIGIPVVNLGDPNFVFVDDFKLHCLKLLEKDEILIDTDVLIFNEVKLELTADLLFDFKDDPSKWWYRDSFSLLEDISIKEQFDDISIPTFVPNIGFLKINNSDLLDEYLSYYSMFRQKIIDKIGLDKTIGQFSMILGQYLLGSIIENKKYSYYCTKENNRSAEYLHLSGSRKYR